MIHKDRTEKSFVLQTRRDFNEDSCDTRGILWGVLVVDGSLFYISVYPLVEPATCMLF